MNKTVFIINGKGGCGKDSLINALEKEEREHGRNVWNHSSIDMVKGIAKNIGWDGEKDEKGRRFLSELKAAISHYSDIITDNTVSVCKDFLISEDRFMFIHIREPEEIEKMKKLLSPLVHVVTILIQAEWEKDSYGNPSDDQVTDYLYDLTFMNKKGIEDSGKEFIKIIHSASDKAMVVRYIMLITYSFDTDYVSVPCRTKEEALFWMNKYLSNEIVTTSLEKEYVPTTLNFSDSEVVLSYADPNCWVIEADNYMEHDYATYKIIEIAHNHVGKQGESDESV